MICSIAQIHQIPAPQVSSSKPLVKIENGWGAYEIDNCPDMRISVFIPAGGYVQVTGGARLFPILGS